PPPPPAQLEAAGPVALDLAGAQEHTVEEGDTLSAIARRFFGDFAAVDYAGTRNGFFFPVIITASDINITNPDFIEPGMVLTIPDLQRNLDSPPARRAIRYSLLDATGLYGIRDRPLEEEGLRRLADSL
ncbi:MAG: LysM peptidoglycan-binding domain-containing protein, partial [Treponema sp.]|nr:LysM peptidoglycan-binding domain-containing protein [Treponema sp.]